MCETKGHNGHNYCPECMCHNADEDHECPPFLKMLMRMHKAKTMEEQFPPLTNNSKRPLDKNFFKPGRVTMWYTPWEKVMWLMKWLLVLFAISGSLFMVRMWMVMQASDISCKAKAYDQLQEVIQVVKNAQGNGSKS